MDAFRIYVVRLVECRLFADGSFNRISFPAIWIVEEGDVGFHGRERRGRELVVVECAEDGLRPENEHVIVVSDSSGSAQDVR
ncbi:hypothetical protein B8W67_16845 [Mycolicibacillus koreensis]|uniref:Uncharacterized protein n=1 Tax=Mycolicibacillus koreensis TaxID=1069220 RepID=A0AA91PC42_9MYCO|nr:hypothetical protein B8W67_16845 [Mycolicibacillus koreensis]